MLALEFMGEGRRHEKAAPESAARFALMGCSRDQVESPLAAAGAGDADESPDDEEPLSPEEELEEELSEDEPLPLDDDEDSLEDSLLSELSAGRLGRP